MIERPLRPIDVSALLRVITAVEVAEGLPLRTPEDELLEELTAEGLDLAVDSIGLFTDDTCVGYGWAHLALEPSPQARWASVNVVVHPEVTGQGHGRRILAWVEARAVELLSSVPDPSPPRTLRAYFHAGQERTAQMAARAGYSITRYFDEMAVDLATTATPVTPEGIRVTGWDADHTEAARSVSNEAFADHWGSTTTTPDDWQRTLRVPRFRPALSTMAFAGEELVGVLVSHVYEEDWPVVGRQEAWISLIGVKRAQRGRGIARALIGQTLSAMSAAGLSHGALGVDTDNPTGAHGLYTSLGFVPTNQLQLWTKGLQS